MYHQCTTRGAFACSRSALLNGAVYGIQPQGSPGARDFGLVSKHAVTVWLIWRRKFKKLNPGRSDARGPARESDLWSSSLRTLMSDLFHPSSGPACRGEAPALRPLLHLSPSDQSHWSGLDGTETCCLGCRRSPTTRYCCVVRR